jgi:hypothetical protein
MVVIGKGSTNGVSSTRLHSVRPLTGWPVPGNQDEPSTDLIIHKAVAGRPQDLYDIQSVVYRQGVKLDVTYVRHWLEEFADILGNRDVVERFEAAWQNR